MNEFVFTSMRRVFIRFLEEIEDSKKTFRNYLTFRHKKREEMTWVTLPFLQKRFDIFNLLRYPLLKPIGKLPVTFCLKSSDGTVSV